MVAYPRLHKHVHIHHTQNHNRLHQSRRRDRDTASRQAAWEEGNRAAAAAEAGISTPSLFRGISAINKIQPKRVIALKNVQNHIHECCFSQLSRVTNSTTEPPSREEAKPVFNQNYRESTFYFGVRPVRLLY